LETAAERYSEKEKECHSIMGRYFSNLVAETERKEKEIHKQPLILNDVSIWLSNCSVNRRRAIEGYYHLIEGELFEEAIDEMCSLEFVCASALSGDLFNVVRQMGKLTSVFHGEESKTRKLDHYFRWIRRRSSLISSNPSWMTRSTAGEEPTESEIYKFNSSICNESLKGNETSVKQWENCNVLTITGKTFFDAVEVEFHGHSDTVSSVAWNHDGSQVASGSYYGNVMIWDAKTAELLLSLNVYSRGAALLKWNHSSSQLITVSKSMIVISNAITGELLKIISKASVNSVAWNDIDSKIVSGSSDMMVDIWDAVTGELLMTMNGHTDRVNTVAWSHSALKIVSGSDDETIKIWDIVTGIELKLIDGHFGKIRSVAWNHDDCKILSGSDNNSIKIWDAINGELVNSIDVRWWANSVSWCQISGSIIVLTDHGLHTMNEATGKLVNLFALDIKDWCYNRSQFQFVSSKQNCCQIQNSSSESLMTTHHGEFIPGHRVLWNSNETMVLTSGRANMPVIWETMNGTPLKSFKANGGGELLSAMWNHDERKVLAIIYLKY
jgi:WD40 repeat protein